MAIELKHFAVQAFKLQSITLLIFLSGAVLPLANAQRSSQNTKKTARSQVILFGGSDGDADQNSFASDFKRAIPLLAHFEKQIYFDGAKSATATERSTWSRSPLAKLAKLPVGKIRSANEKNLRMALEKALSGPQALDSGDQLLIDINTHGTEKPHQWASENDQSIDPRVLRPYLTRLKQRGVRVGLLDESCFGGKSVEIFSDLACVVSSAPKDTYACGDEMQSALEDALSSKSSGVSLEDLYLSALRRIKGDSNCFGNAQFSGALNDSVGRAAESVDNACSGVSAYSALEKTLEDLRRQVSQIPSPNEKRLQALKASYENSLSRFAELQKMEKTVFKSWAEQDEWLHRGEAQIKPQSYYFEHQDELLQLLSMRQGLVDGRLTSMTAAQPPPQKPAFRVLDHHLYFEGKLSRGNFNVSVLEEAKRLYEKRDAQAAQKDSPLRLSSLNPVARAERINELAGIISRLDGERGHLKRQAMQKSLASLKLIAPELQNRTTTIRQELAEIRQVEGSTQADRYEQEKKYLLKQKQSKTLSRSESIRLERITRCSDFKLN